MKHELEKKELIESYQEPKNITAYHGDLEIIGDGVSPSTSDNPLKIKIHDLELCFEFLSNKTNGMKVEKKVKSDNELLLTLTNFNNSLGSGIIKPTEIGLLKNKKIYISFFIWIPNNDGSRLINWTILQEKNTDNKGYKDGRNTALNNS